MRWDFYATHFEPRANARRDWLLKEGWWANYHGAPLYAAFAELAHNIILASESTKKGFSTVGKEARGVYTSAHFHKASCYATPHFFSAVRGFAKVVLLVRPTVAWTVLFGTHDAIARRTSAEPRCLANGVRCTPCVVDIVLSISKTSLGGWVVIFASGGVGCTPRAAKNSECVGRSVASVALSQGCRPWGELEDA